ncbi:MAG: hypothetical protein HY537_03065 [Deltaproteobacteria bacterium]|nr:hypothetical protein [Deltaproteobacteria bacterium]
MLERLDLDRIFASARHKGFGSCEIYCETTTQSLIQFSGKSEDTRFHGHSGVGLRLDNGRASRFLKTTEMTTQAILKLLGEEADGCTQETFMPESTEKPKADQTLTAEKRASRLSQWCKEILCDERKILQPCLRYDDKIQTFEMVNSMGQTGKGQEQTAQMVVRWAVESKETEQPFHARISRTSINSFFEALDNNPIESQIRRSLKNTKWPVPCAHLPVLWMPTALSKIMLPFIRAFEGDLVLHNLSFLTDYQFPIPLSFSIVDLATGDNFPTDHEGSPRRAMVLFDEGRPRGLTCNIHIAEQLNVKSTGHCRRESFACPPTIGVWTPSIQSSETEHALEQNMERGLCIHDVEVTHFDPATTMLRLICPDTELVHHGELGESVQTFELEIGLLDLLRSLKTFSKQQSIIGHAIAKSNQRLFCDMTVPQAFSESLPIPGTVPASHYWQI